MLMGANFAKYSNAVTTVNGFETAADLAPTPRAMEFSSVAGTRRSIVENFSSVAGTRRSIVEDFSSVAGTPRSMWEKTAGRWVRPAVEWWRPTDAR
jgi:hypothetical protein